MNIDIIRAHEACTRTHARGCRCHIPSQPHGASHDAATRRAAGEALNQGLIFSGVDSPFIIRLP